MNTPLWSEKVSRGHCGEMCHGMGCHHTPLARFTHLAPYPTRHNTGTLATGRGKHQGLTSGMEDLLVRLIHRSEASSVIRTLGLCAHMLNGPVSRGGRRRTTSRIHYLHSTNHHLRPAVCYTRRWPSRRFPDYSAGTH